jgi:hypothetical protein
VDARPPKILLALLAALLLIPATASAAPVTAKMSDSLVDSIGVNTHTYYNDTVYYSHFETVKQRIAELGVRHIRENLMVDRDDQYERLRELAAVGARSTLILGDPIEGTANLEELVSIVKDELGGAVAAVEGPNEFDLRGGPGWASELRSYQQQLYASIKSDPALAGLPVIGPSIVHSSAQQELGDISSLLDYGNIHSYPDGYSPESNLDRHFEDSAPNSGQKQLMATETGYHTAVGWTGEHKPVSEEAMATYIPRMYLEYFRRGVARTFSYELLDEAPGATEREDTFGLLHNDLSPKPAFVALRNLIDILEDPGPAFSPAPLPYTLNGDTEDVHHLLLQKRSGAFYLALWRDVDVWDPVSQTPAAAHSGGVSVDFGRVVNGARAYLPNVSTAPVAVAGGGSAPVSLEVGPQVVILEVGAGRPKSGRIKLWVSKRSVRAGGRVAVKGKLPRYAAGRSLRVKIQQWHKGSWRTVGRSRTRRSGTFRKKIRVPLQRTGPASRVRVVARAAKPSRPVRVRIRRG